MGSCRCWLWCAWWRVIRCGVGSSESACGGGGGQWDRPRMRQTLIHIPGHSVATGGQRHIHPPAQTGCTLHTLHCPQQVAAQKVYKCTLHTTLHLQRACTKCQYTCVQTHQTPQHPLNSKCQTYPHWIWGFFRLWMGLMSKSTENVGITVLLRASQLAWRPASNLTQMKCLPIVSSWSIHGLYSCYCCFHTLPYSTVRNIWGTRVLVPRHQNSGAPTFLFLVFLEVYARPCWQCSD